MATSSWFKRVHKSGLKSIERNQKEETPTQRQRDVKGKKNSLDDLISSSSVEQGETNTNIIGKQKGQKGR
jgi:hypothetical protein